LLSVLMIYKEHYSDQFTLLLTFTQWSEENGISHYIITTCSNIYVMRIKDVITKDKTSWYLDKFSLLVP